MKGTELIPGVARRVSKRDLLQIVDAAYAGVPNDQDWLGGVLAAALPVLEWGIGVCAYTFRLGESVQIANFVHSQSGAALRDGVEEMLRHAPPLLLRSAFVHNHASTLSEFLACDLAGLANVGSQLARHRARDVLGIVACDPSGLGILLGSLLPTSGSLPASARHIWLQIASHLDAGLRLRASPRREADAVLDASGALHDARGLALDKSARVALRQAARAIDRARSQRVAEPDAALAFRQALAGGYWSLVDRFDADGRHFLVACRNPRGPVAPADLSLREHQATALAARGHSNKLIASALGVSTGSVSTLLYRAARKIGTGSRALLIREWLNQYATGPLSLDNEHRVGME